jgi:hypothetical protein
VQRLDQHDVGGGEPGERIKEGVELLAHACGACTAFESVARSTSTLTGFAR